MVNYTVYLSDESKKDIYTLTNVIMYEYKAPATAFKYIQGLLDTILSLEQTAEAFPLQSHRFFLKYGQYVRRINYKRMAIIYTVYGSTVYIHRVMPAASISE